MSVSGLRALLVRHAVQASVVAFCLLVVAGMWVGLALQLSGERETILRTAHRENGNYARILDEHLGQTLRAVEIVLAEVAAEYRTQGDRLDLARLANELHVSTEPYLSLAVIDEQGNLRRASYVIQGRPNFSERENHLFHVAHETREIFISKPRRVTSGPNPGRWSIIISQRLNRPDGSYAGYVAVAFDPFYFSQLYAQVDLGRDSVLTLLGRDGVIRARKEGAELSAGQDVSGSTLFQTIVRSPASEGQLVGRGQLAHVTRLYSYRAVKNHPLVVLVGRSEEAVLQNYLSRRQAYFGWAGGATLLIALFAGLLIHLIEHRSRSEARLRESEQRYLDLVEHASDGIFIADERQRYVQVNRAACEMLGYAQDELLAMSMSDLVTEEDLRKQPFRIDELRAGKSLLVERRLRRKDGVLVPVEISARMLANGLHQAIVRDITERKRAEEVLRESEARFRDIVESFPSGVLLVDADGKITLVNRRLLAQFGYTAAELVGQSVEALVPQNLRPLHAADRERYQSAAQLRQMGMGRDLHAVRKDGTPFPVEIGLQPINLTGRTATLVTVIDITERKAAEESLRRSDTLFREMGANIPDFLWVRDAKTGELLYVNPGWQRISGRKAEIGEDFRRMFEITLPEDMERLRQSAARTSDGGFNEVIRVRHADGSIRWVHFRSFPIRNEAGEIYRVAGVGEDITERVRAEEELRRLNSELEARVEARTAELRQSLEELRATQARLVQSEKMAALGSLVAGIAHEINTPLGIGVTAASHVEVAVRGLNERFARGELTRQEMERFLGNSLEACEMVLANLQRAADLIRSFKQVAVDQSSGERRVFALKPYLEEVLLSLAPQLRRTRHEVLLECDAGLEIDSYPGAYSQVLTNLVMNSLVHGFDGIERGHIEIEARRDGESLRLRYRDNGRGIAPEHLPKIFDPFFTTKRGLGGSGLGLHVVYNLVTQTLGGTIECRSRPGEGVSFEIDLPLRPPQRMAA